MAVSKEKTNNSVAATQKSPPAGKPVTWRGAGLQQQEATTINSTCCTHVERCTVHPSPIKSESSPTYGWHCVATDYCPTHTFTQQQAALHMMQDPKGPRCLANMGTPVKHSGSPCKGV